MVSRLLAAASSKVALKMLQEQDTQYLCSSTDTTVIHFTFSHFTKIFFFLNLSKNVKNHQFWGWGKYVGSQTQKDKICWRPRFTTVRVFVRSSLLFAQKFLKWPFLGPYCTQNAVLGGKHAQIKKRLHIGILNIPQNVYLAGSVFWFKHSIPLKWPFVGL